MSSRRRYRNPPVQEAICELRFASHHDWDPTVPGKLHAALATDYPGQPRQRATLNLQVGEPQAEQTVSVMVQLFSEDGTRVVSVGPHVLSIHMLPPYQRTGGAGVGWDEFLPRIRKALDAYRALARPTGIVRVGLRYINRIVIPSPDPDPAEYVVCAPAPVPGLPPRTTAFLNRREQVDEDGVRVVITCASAEATEERYVMLLDIDVALATSDEVLTMEAAITTAEDLRTRERAVFEALITDRARRLFDDGIR